MKVHVCGFSGWYFLSFECGGATVCLAGTQFVWLDQYEPHSSLNERLV